jgi:hypothetical protein
MVQAPPNLYSSLFAMSLFMLPSTFILQPLSLVLDLSPPATIPFHPTFPSPLTYHIDTKESFDPVPVPIPTDYIKFKNLLKRSRPVPVAEAPLLKDGKRWKKGLSNAVKKVCNLLDEQETLTKTSLFEQISNEPMTPEDRLCIQRRAYDAVNVMSAIGVITKTKQQLGWNGLPIEWEERRKAMINQKRGLEDRIKQKQKELEALMVEVVCLKNLRIKNERRERIEEPHIPIPSTFISVPENKAVEIHTSGEKTHLSLHIEGPYTLTKRADVLCEMGLAHIEPYDLPRLLPKAIVPLYPGRFLLDQTS